ncbi:MAG: endonuclease III [Candidatus Melainabacteria bacterium]|nr:endonuclease III [Candidatus Melainabacteria bacterium]
MRIEIKKILLLLKKQYPNVKTALSHKNPLELLIATILSAQCTDARVNIVTKNLFKKYKKARDYADANVSDFEKEIYSTGFFRNKAKNIIASCQIIDKKYNGKVPDNFEKLLELPGVARKTANCVMGNAFNVPSGVIVDTHVLRIAQRLGLTKNTDPNKVEQDLIKIIPRDEWISFSHMIIEHGRKICDARKPKCEICMLNKLCFYSSILHKTLFY